MKQFESYDLICREYIDLLNHDDYGCDRCIAEVYCIENHLKDGRYPKEDCSGKLKLYLKER